ncbi:MAG: hypothetical protein J6H31_12790 [Butyrivibrio sp.]|nr:hypothetical protein [Butyrivibrio sp.]
MGKKKIIRDIGINEISQIMEREETHYLFWPVYSYDNDGRGIVKTDKHSFPDDNEIIVSYQLAKEWRGAQDSTSLVLQGRQVRQSAGSSCEEFWRNLGDCNIAYIVDKRFSTDEFKLMVHFLDGADNKIMRLQEIFIFCDRDYAKLSELNEERDKTEYKISVYAIPTQPLYEIHDRFAVLDDEIWHFGGTVGGINPQLTAYSRGWRDLDGSFRRYIKSMIGK